MRQCRPIEAKGVQLTRVQKGKAVRIYEKRDRVTRLIQEHLKNYYNTVINGDYRFDGCPEIDRGIKGRIETKTLKVIGLYWWTRRLTLPRRKRRILRGSPTTTSFSGNIKN